MNRFRGAPGVVAARKELSGLISETEAFIGGVAKNGFRKLSKLPPAEYYPQDKYDGGIYSDESFFKPRRIIGAADLPDGPVAVGDTGLSITNTSTEVFRRCSYSRYGKPMLRLPATKKLVTVDFGIPAEPSAKLTMSISTSGQATVNRLTNRTLPNILDGDLSRGVFGYRSPENLRGSYARSYSGALAVTRIVADSLFKVHGIESVVAPGDELFESWQGVDPSGTVTRPDFSSFLPKSEIEA